MRWMVPLLYLVAGCGPLAIGAGANALFRDDSKQDLVDPVVAIASEDGADEPPPANFGIGTPVRLLLRTNKDNVAMRVFEEVGTQTARADVNGCPRDNRGDLMALLGVATAPVEPLEDGAFGIVHEAVVGSGTTEVRLWVQVEDPEGRRACADHVFRVDRAAPAAPEDVSVEARRSHELEVTWTPSTSPDVVGYRIVWDVPTDAAGAASTVLPPDLGRRVRGESYNLLIDAHAPPPDEEQTSSGLHVVGDATATATLRGLHALRPHFVQVQAVDLAGNRSPLTSGGEVAARTRSGGDGRFLAPVAAGVANESVHYPAIADFDGDRLLDTAWAVVPETTLLLRFGVPTRAADGSLSVAVRQFDTGLAVPAQDDLPTPAATADFNHDGWPDLAVLHAADHASDLTIHLMLLGPPATPTGAPVLKRSTAAVFDRSDGRFRLEALRIFAGDFNADGRADVAILFDSCNVGVMSIDYAIFTGDGAGGLTELASGSEIARRFHDVAVADVDRNGVPDFIVADTASITSVMMTRDGTVAALRRFSSGGLPRSLALTDFDGDRLLDLAVSHEDGSLAVLRGVGADGRGDGRFLVSASRHEGTSAGVLAAGKFDGDGIPDIALASRAPNRLRIFRGSREGGSYSFEDPLDEVDVNETATALFAVDVDRDEIADVVMQGAGSQFLFGGRGAVGRGLDGFDRGVELAPGGLETIVGFEVRVWDIDRDGTLDVAIGVSNFFDDGVLLVYRGVGVAGQGDGSFAAPEAFFGRFGRAVDAIAIDDYDKNGVPDVVTGAHPFAAAVAQVFLGTPGGSLAEPVDLPVVEGFQEWHAADFDRDGNPDVVGLNSLFDLRYGNGDGSFAQVLGPRPGAAPSTMTVGDFNADGLPDVVAVGAPTLELALARRATDGVPQRGLGALTGLGATLQGTAAVAADLNRDGRADLLLVHDTKFQVALAENGGPAGGLFRAGESLTVPADTNHLAVADFNRDGRLDVLVGGKIYFGQNESGRFANPVDAPVPAHLGALDRSAMGQVAIADVNADGIPDIVFNNTVHLGRGTIVER